MIRCGVCGQLWDRENHEHTRIEWEAIKVLVAARLNRFRKGAA